MKGPAHPGAYVHGPGVTVPDEVALWLERNTNLRQVRQLRVFDEPVVGAVLVALAVGARRARDATPGSATGSADGSASGTKPTSDPPVEAASERRVDVGAAARQLGLTDRAVRKAIGSGRLPATQVAGRAWSIAQDDVDEYARRRRAR